MNKHWRAGLWVTFALTLGAVLLGIKFNSSFNLETNILQLLPEERQNNVIDRAYSAFTDRGMKRLVFLAGNADPAVARSAAETLSVSLGESAYIEEVRFQIEESEQTAIAGYIFANRHLLLNEREAALLRNGQFDTFADFTLQQIFSPVSAGLPSLLPADPFLLSYRYGLSAGNDASPSLTLDDGLRQYEQDGLTYVLVDAALSGAPFDQNIQADILRRISMVEQGWQAAGESTELLRTGSLFYADYGYQTARHEITLIGGASLLLIVSLFVLCFFSLRPILMVMLALGFGMGLGFIAARLLFGQVHVLTLVFGASLLGVAVDYAFHYFTVPGTFSETGSSGGEYRLRRIFPAIFLGLVSSVIGYLALASTPFPGLRQMAVFCIFGLAGAWMTIVLLFPVIPLRIQCSGIMLSACHHFLSLGRRTGARIVFLLFTLVPVVSLGIYLSSTPAEHDIRMFQANDNQLAREEAQVLSLFDAPASNQFYLVTAETPQQLLENMELAQEALNEFKAQGIIQNYQSIASWLPSRGKQENNYALYEELYASDALQALINAGVLDANNVAEIREAFAEDSERRLTLQEWEASRVSEEIADLWLGEIGMEGEPSVFAAVIALQGINNLAALQDIAPDIIFVDKVGTVNELMDEYQVNAGMLLLVALLGIYLLLSWRYGFTLGSLVIALPLISVSSAYLGLTLMGESVTLFNTLALFLITGISVDFGIFFAEAGSVSSHTLLAIVLSAFTTLFSFGMLSLSETPVISSFGLTLLLGIFIALLLSPVIGNLIQNRKAAN